MKALARHHLWWPGLDNDIESTARDNANLASRKPTTQPPALLHPWEYPTRPWQRVHIDFAGPAMGSHG